MPFIFDVELFHDDVWRAKEVKPMALFVRMQLQPFEKQQQIIKLKMQKQKNNRRPRNKFIYSRWLPKQLIHCMASDIKNNIDHWSMINT